MNSLTMITRLALVLPTAVVTGRLFGSCGILACFTVSDALTLVIVYLYHAVRFRKIFPSKKDYLDLPDSFHLHPGDVISLDIRDLKDVTLASEQIMLFCRGHKLKPRTAFYASLAFEELCSNIVVHGFPGCKSPRPMIDMRTVISGNALVIRLRDNCPHYVVTEAIAAANEAGSDPVHNIGTRIVSRIAKDITCLHTFDTNSLIVSFTNT